MKRGEIWWADLGAHRPHEQTGLRPAIVWQSDTLTSVLESVMIVPLTTNVDRAGLAGTVLLDPSDDGPTEPSVALAFQIRAVSKSRLRNRIRALTADELDALELATDEALGRSEP